MSFPSHRYFYQSGHTTYLGNCSPLFFVFISLLPHKQELLEKTYHDSSQLDDLPSRIRQVTLDSAGGHAAFASIVWGRPAQLVSPTRGAAADGSKSASLGGSSTSGGGNSFYDALQLVQCDVLLLYGAEDPWCGPAFGRAAARARGLQNDLKGEEDDNRASTAASATSRPDAAAGPVTRYVELSSCGHCPHHEAPEATNELLADWLSPSLERADWPGSGSWGGVKAREVRDFQPKSLWERALVAALR